MVKIYKQPFAHDGDAIAIPDVSQPDGKVSSADGWTVDYQLPKTDPNYKPVGRREMNGVFKEVTEALGQVQVYGAAVWSPDGAPYPVSAQVYHGGKQWLARRANSVEPAEGEDWSAVDTTLRQDLANPDKGAAMVARGVAYYDSLNELNSAATEPHQGQLAFVHGTVFGWSGASWVPAGPVHVRALGAIGVGDETAQIQAAIDLASEAGGREVIFEPKVYTVRDLKARPGVTLNLNGATLRLAPGVNTHLMNGATGGTLFRVLNGTFDGNADENHGSGNSSGVTFFRAWEDVKFENVKFENIFRVGLSFFTDEGKPCSNIKLSGLSFDNCGRTNAFGTAAYGIEFWPGTRDVQLDNISVKDHYGFGIHFNGVDNFTLDGLTAENLSMNDLAIAITITDSRKGVLTNIDLKNVDGDNIEINSGIDITIDNVHIDGAGRYPLLIGRHLSNPERNRRVIIRNWSTVNTGGDFSVTANWMEQVELDHCDFDKPLNTTVTGEYAADRSNKISDTRFASDVTNSVARFQKFSLERVRFNNFYVNVLDGTRFIVSAPHVDGPHAVEIPSGESYAIKIGDIYDLGTQGMMVGKLRLVSRLNNNQATLHECAFVVSNNGTTFNVGDVAVVSSAIARKMTISGDAATSHLIVGNDTGVAVRIWWLLDFVNVES